MPFPRYRVLVLSILLLLACSLFAQESTRPAFSHPLNMSREFNAGVRSAVLVPETLKVLVAMIAFQEDNEPRTSGTGSFDTTISTRKIIDPPPHNLAYVQNHLTFAENYFQKASNGKLVVAPTILPGVYRLAQKMASYSPPRSSTTNLQIGNLMQDAWHLVDSLTPGLQFQNYSAFVILHAGVGRDVDLSSQLGFDPTPFDIPSLYINLTALQKMFGPSFDGISVEGGSFKITSSIILPETENREINTGLGIALLQLGINGLTVASLGSHLGLPDLFDTKTGRSGIGRFGLMDGQSIFSWDGVFPPEPSAWEKYYLGWISPITVPPGEGVYSLPAPGLSSDPDSVYRVPISAKEYFLVENRNRDANRDGATVTIERNGLLIQKTYYRDTTNFNAFDQDSIWGNVIDVDEFDWSLPGGVNSRTGEFFDGGILIWHIDEGVIDANLASDAVNANPDRRGVDLEEADGSQDIGQNYGFISPGSGSEDGTPLDFWYNGNTATPRLLSNEFTPNSHPNSLSNDFANSHIYIKEFSTRSPRMTAKIQLGDDEIKGLVNFPKATSRMVGINSLRFSGSQLFIATQQFMPSHGPIASVPVSARLYGWNVDGTSINGFFTSGLIAETPQYPPEYTFTGTPVIADVNKDLSPDLIEPDLFNNVPSLDAWQLHDSNNDSLAERLGLTSSFQRVTTSVVGGDSVLAIGTQHGALILVTYGGPSLGVSGQIIAASDTSDIVGVSLWQKPDQFIAVSAAGRVSFITPGFVPDQVESRNFSATMNSPCATGLISSTMGRAFALATEEGKVYLVDGSLTDFPGFPFSTGGEIKNSPVLADIDADGSKDIIVFSGNKIWAINASGAVLDHFPITVSTSKTILTSPIVADLDGDGTPDIVAVTQEGLMVAYDKSGKMVRGFPILAGTNGGSTPAAFYMPSACLSCIDIGLAVASDDGQVYAWKTGTLITGPSAPPEMPWPQYMHDEQNSGLDGSTPTGAPSQTFFPESRAYNWPNPVRAQDNYKTHIRYYVASDAKVVVKIFDLAGDLVTELSGNGIGGLDNEMEWDVSGIQSGVYLAHIDAQGSSGSGTAIIKIAVVK
ncbi:MAG TPA: hypothetical protein VL633_03725 [Bacteroidota bacterium]|nr:hypothetical protein [Bacteroidota bacterium]